VLVTAALYDSSLPNMSKTLLMRAPTCWRALDFATARFGFRNPPTASRFSASRAALAVGKSVPFKKYASCTLLLLPVFAPVGRIAATVRELSASMKRWAQLLHNPSGYSAASSV
jgi:hypothetical protein